LAVDVGPFSFFKKIRILSSWWLEGLVNNFIRCMGCRWVKFENRWCRESLWRPWSIKR